MRADPAQSVDAALRAVALVGQPNSGKTTLYSWLTGSKFKSVNYPGATADCSVGISHKRYGDPVAMIDTPGTYSLSPKAPDEEVTIEALFNRRLNREIHGLIVVLDSTQLDRQLFLAEQIKQTGYPFVLVLTMEDLTRKNGFAVDKSLLETHFGVKVVLTEGRLGQGMVEVLDAVRDLKPVGLIKLPKFTKQEAENLFTESQRLAKKVLLKRAVPSKHAPASFLASSTEWDRWLLHPVFGVVIFIAACMGLFTSIFWLASPFMDGLDATFGWLSEQILSLGQGALWADFLANGVVTSFGAVLTFVPQIFILFLGIGFLEDSGYLARAATLIDRPFAKIGLSGRSFVPLLSGHACAVPAVMATRNLRSQKERWIVNFILPWMTCSARLPVYALLLTFLWQGSAAWKPGVTLALIYMTSLAIGALAAAVLNRFVKTRESSFFILELPIYRRPKFAVILRSSWLKTMSYARRAGPIIFVLALALWSAAHFPRLENGEAPKLENSILGKAGHLVEPLFTPMGVDWRVGVGILSSFAAREVFVSSLAVVFNVTEQESRHAEDSLNDKLIGKMQGARLATGEPVFTIGSVVGLIAFFMIALQCASTLAIVGREMRSWKFAATQFLFMNTFAYLAAIFVYQISKRIL